MGEKAYKLRTLPLFEEDLNEILDYITYTLNNPDAAERLLNDVEQAVYHRLNHPVSFEHVSTKHNRTHPYYKILVHNYIVFYVVIDDVMELRRIFYYRRNWQELI